MNESHVYDSSTAWPKLHIELTFVVFHVHLIFTVGLVYRSCGSSILDELYIVSEGSRLRRQSSIMKKCKKNCCERLAEWVGTIRRESAREENAEFFSRQKTKARTVVGMGEEESA